MKNRKVYIVASLILSLFMTISITALQSMSNTVTIVDDRAVSKYETSAANVGEVLEELHITLGEKDTVTPSLDTKVKSDTNIIIDRWKPTISFTLDGQTSTFETSLKTVRDIVDLKGLLDKEGVTVEPGLDTPVTDKMNIIVKTKQILVKTVEETVPFKTEEKYTTDLKPGETKVSQEGQEGLKKKTIEVVTIGGEIVQETVKEEVIVTEPKDKIILIGKEAQQISVGGLQYEFTKSFNMEATAYTDEPGTAGITASGNPTFVGMVAVDPRVIPLGTKLYVEGYGLAIAGDTGGAIKGNKIDLFFKTRQECVNFGRRNRNVYVLKDQSIDVISARK